MFCRYCSHYRDGKRTPTGRICSFSDKTIDKEDQIPNKKGEPCKGFSFIGTFWCYSNQHYKNHTACFYNYRTNDDCSGCLQKEEIDICMEIHQKNNPVNLRPKLVFLQRRKLTYFKWRILSNTENI